MNLSGTFSADAAVELAVTTRDGFVESRHVGSAVVLSPDGEVVAEYGAHQHSSIHARR